MGWLVGFLVYLSICFLFCKVLKKKREGVESVSSPVYMADDIRSGRQGFVRVKDSDKTLPAAISFFQMYTLDIYIRLFSYFFFLFPPPDMLFLKRRPWQSTHYDQKMTSIWVFHFAVILCHVRHIQRIQYYGYRLMYNSLEMRRATVTQRAR